MIGHSTAQVGARLLPLDSRVDNKLLPHIKALECQNARFRAL